MANPKAAPLFCNPFALPKRPFAQSALRFCLSFRYRDWMGKDVETIRVAICDDEANIRSLLASLIRRQDPTCQITEYAGSNAYLQDEREHDLLFLDIELSGRQAPNGINGMEPGDAQAPGAMNGVELARKLRRLPLSRQPVIIFVTGYDSYVYEAFDVEAFQYLLKPLDEIRFGDVFRRAAEKIAACEGQQGRPLIIQSAGVSRVVALPDIYYIESQSHKLLLHLRDGCLEYYGKMGDLEQELQGRFSRIHKGYLVNLAYVEQYSRSEAVLTDGTRLMISKRKYDAFARAHLRFLRQ